jgi:hypothetical protein
MAQNLVSEGPTHPKTAGALTVFKQYATSAKFTDAEKSWEFIGGGLKSWTAVSGGEVTKSMEHSHEAIKTEGAKHSAVAALTPGKVYVAENTHKLLLKSKQDKEAEKYM